MRKSTWRHRLWMTSILGQLYHFTEKRIPNVMPPSLYVSYYEQCISTRHPSEEAHGRLSMEVQVNWNTRPWSRVPGSDILRETDIWLVQENWAIYVQWHMIINLYYRYQSLSREDVGEAYGELEHRKSAHNTGIRTIKISRYWLLVWKMLLGVCGIPSGEWLNVENAVGCLRDTIQRMTRRWKVCNQCPAG